jgi:hypothetical protein
MTVSEAIGGHCREGIVVRGLLACWLLVGMSYANCEEERSRPFALEFRLKKSAVKRDAESIAGEAFLFNRSNKDAAIKYHGAPNEFVRVRVFDAKGNRIVDEPNAIYPAGLPERGPSLLAGGNHYG